MIHRSNCTAARRTRPRRAHFREPDSASRRRKIGRARRGRAAHRDSAQIASAKRGIRSAAEHLEFVFGQSYFLRRPHANPSRGHTFPWKGFRRRKPNLPGTPERLGAPALGFGILRTPPTRYPPARHSAAPRLSNPDPDFSESRMAAENGPLEIVRERFLPAPAQSAEPPNIRGFLAVCQFRGNPLISVLRADADVFAAKRRRSCAWVRRREDIFHRRDSPPKRARRTEKMARRRQGPKQSASGVRAAIFFFVSRSMPISAAAASLEPPPSPRATGIRFSSRARIPPRIPISQPSASIARYTRFSGPAGNSASSVSRKIPGLEVRESSSVSRREIA